MCSFVFGGVSRLRMGGDSVPPPAGKREYSDALRRAQDLAGRGEAAQGRMLVSAAGQRAPSGDRPSANAVAQALRILEKERVQSKRKVDMPMGSYRLVLIANEKKKDRKQISGQYFPIYGSVSFFPEEQRPKDEETTQGIITNTAKIPIVGGVQFTGWFQWIPRRNKLDFNFYRIALRLFGLPAFSFELKRDKTISDREYFNTAEEKRKLPFFTFFFVENDLLGYRGRGGGLALAKLESLTVGSTL